MTPTIQVYLDGVRAADGHDPNEPALAPFVVDGLTGSWGRSSTIDQPDGDVCSFTMIRRLSATDDQFAVFNKKLKLGVRVDVDAGAGHRVFTGQVTSLVLSASPSGWAQYDIVADDVLSDLSNRPAGTTSRPVEKLPARANYILTGRGVPISIAATIVDMRVKAFDPDSDSGSTATSMLQELAVSAGATLWSTTTPADDPALLMETPSSRPALRRLAKPGALVVIVVDTVHVTGLVTIDACVPDLEPIRIVQNMDDLITSCAVTYYDETAAYAPKVVLIRDEAAESKDRPFGVRRSSLDSQLVTYTDASTVASSIVARLHDPGWGIEGLVVDDDLDDDDMRVLLAADTRIGRPIELANLPPWVPDMGTGDTFVGYLEGGTYTSTQGVWSTTLNVAAALSYAGANARWTDLDTATQAANTWQWNQFDPDISWLDLQGVAGPA